MTPKLADLVDEWIARDKSLKRYRVSPMPVGWIDDDLLYIECTVCWANFGWIGADRVFSNLETLPASDPQFFKKLKLILIKHTKKCKTQI